MKIITVIENTDGGTGLLCEHGLAVYVETEKHKVLVDAGSSSLSCQNADTLGIDLSEVDTLVLSHGHYDHSGGILPFAERNATAEIYMQKTATQEYMSTSNGAEHYIGIDPKIQKLPQVRLLTLAADEEKVEENTEVCAGKDICTKEEIYKIDEELQIFSGIKGRRFSPNGNKVLYEKVNGELVQDSFAHEECLAVFCEGKKLLFSGCAHNGIVNILDRYKELFGDDPDYVFSGFHMMKSSEYDEEDIQIIKGTADVLKRKKTIYYSGHCTSLPGFEILKEILGDQLQYMHSGLSIEI